MSALVQRERTFLRSVGDEPLPGYRLLAPLGIGGFGEVWKCLAPGGLHKAIKFVGEDPDDDPAERTSLQQEHDAFERVKGIRHPFLMTLERVELLDGELLMVMELADRSLAHRYDECRAGGLPGIPRTELLSYMVDAAEALDVLGREHGLQHMDVKPANLFLLGGHVKVGDYGLVARHKTGVCGEEPKLGRGLTPKYVAPEILADRVHARSDQYPLALVYQELLTGVFPYPGRTSRQLLMQHTSAEPDLTALPARDRTTVGRALSKDPALRFSSCLSFVKALLREDDSGGTRSVTATLRIPAARPPLSDTSLSIPALVTPLVRNHESASADATQRFNPTVPNGPLGPPSGDRAVEFDRTHPGFTYLGESPATPRGRVVRVRDSAGGTHLAHLLNIPAEHAGACAPVLKALAASDPFQAVIRPNPQAVTFLVSEGCRTLADEIAERKNSAQPALRRSEIRAMLAPIAAALDGLFARNAFAHGLLSPATIVRRGAAWGVALYGLGELLNRTRSDRAWLPAELYAAPEAAGDQYSLALIFLQLAGAWSPPERRSQRTDPGGIGFRYNREALHACESAAVQKALATDPERRFGSCTEFLAALRPPPTAGVVLEEVRAVESSDRLTDKAVAEDAPPFPERLTDALLRSAGALAVASWPSADAAGLVLALPDGRLSCRFPVKLSAELALLKLRAFNDRRGSELVQWTADTYALKPSAGTSGAAGKGIELVVQLPSGDRVGAREVAVTGRTLGGAKRADEPIVLLIEQFRRAVQNTDERRRAPRFRTELPMLAYPVDDELAVRAPIAGTARDVSGTGFACVLRAALATGHAFVTFPTVPEFGKWVLLAKIVRTDTGSAGAALVAGRFVHAGN